MLGSAEEQVEGHNETRLYASALRWWCLIIAAGGVLGVVFSGILSEVLQFMALVLATICLLFGVLRCLMSSRRMLQIDQQGLTERCFLETLPLSWRDIERFEVYRDCFGWRSRVLIRFNAAAAQAWPVRQLARRIYGRGLLPQGSALLGSLHSTYGKSAQALATLLNEKRQIALAGDMSRVGDVSHVVLHTTEQRLYMARNGCFVFALIGLLLTSFCFFIAKGVVESAAWLNGEYLLLGLFVLGVIGVLCGSLLLVLLMLLLILLLLFPDTAYVHLDEEGFTVRILHVFVHHRWADIEDMRNSPVSGVSAEFVRTYSETMKTKLADAGTFVRFFYKSRGSTSFPWIRCPIPAVYATTPGELTAIFHVWLARYRQTRCDAGKVNPETAAANTMTDALALKPPPEESVLLRGGKPHGGRQRVLYNTLLMLLLGKSLVREFWEWPSRDLGLIVTSVLLCIFVVALLLDLTRYFMSRRFRLKLDKGGFTEFGPFGRVHIAWSDVAHVGMADPLLVSGAEGGERIALISFTAQASQTGAVKKLIGNRWCLRRCLPAGAARAGVFRRIYGDSEEDLAALMEQYRQCAATSA